MKPKFDLDGNPIKPQKCKNCKRERREHNAKTSECPQGRKHRTFGYQWFGHTKFEAVTEKVKA